MQKPGIIRRLLISIVVLCSLSQPAFAWHEGIGISVPLITQVPSGLHGISGTIWYEPGTLNWRQFYVFFDALGAYYWVNGTTPYNLTKIVAVSPVLRYRFHVHYGAVPFIDLSIGLSYISNTHFGNRNLGMHFAFQDRAGIGLLIGSQEQFVFGVHAVHYSNAGLSSNNSGITIPLVLDFTYKIQ